MNISNDAIRFIMLNEGMKLNVYKDFGGNLIIGFGHRVTAKDNLKFADKISEDEATDFLIKDLHTASEAIDSLRLDINQNQYDALLDFTFNCGVNNLYRLTKNGCRSSEQIYAAWVGLKLIPDALHQTDTEESKGGFEIFTDRLEDNNEVSDNWS